MKSAALVLADIYFDLRLENAALRKDRDRLDKLADLQILEGFANQNKDIHERACEAAVRVGGDDALDLDQEAMKPFYRVALREMIDEL